MTNQTPADDLDLTYAIGDIHGRADLLEVMLEKIRIRAGGDDYTIVTLGDYVDRGPDSRKVFDILMRIPNLVPLRGNHEQMLLDAATGGRGEVEHFLLNGGVTTLASFGVGAAHRIPKIYLDWISKKTRFYYETENQVFVHAGVAWSQPDMSRQREELMIWIREGFLDHDEPFFKYIVHGHTPYHKGKPNPAKPEVHSHRCNLDTGAYMTGILTCGVFTSERGPPTELIVAHIEE